MTTFDLNRTMFLDPRQTPVSAWLGHIPMAGWLVEAIKPKLLVELGTHLGASYFAFCQAVQENGLDTRCYAVDTWQGDEHAGRYGEDVFSAVSGHHRQHYDGFSKLMRMTFDEAAGYFDEGSIDLLHIDGLHTYEAVRHDFETWLPKMSAKGVILFHDTNVRERDFGVWKFWAEVREKYPSFEFSHTHGLGVLLAGSEPPRSLRAFIDVASEATAAAEVNTLFERLGALITTRDQLAGLSQRQIHLDGDNGHLRGVVAERDATLAKQQATVEQLQSSLQMRDNEMNQLQSSLRSRDAELAQRQASMEQLQAQLVQAHEALRSQDDILEASRVRQSEIERERDRLASDVRASKEMLESQRIAAEASVASLQAQSAEREARLSDAVATIGHRQAEIERLMDELDASNGKVSALLGSSSWRVTAPLRALMSLFIRKQS